MHPDGQRFQDDRVRLRQGRDVINWGQINIVWLERTYLEINQLQEALALRLIAAMFIFFTKP